MDLNRVDLNLLVALDALLDERSVTRAADRLSVGQSAMSATLVRLRKLFDDPIFVRQGRNLVTTPFAETLAEPVKDTLARIDSLLTAGRTFDPKTGTRTFSVLASDYTTMVFLKPLLNRLAESAPGVVLSIRPAGDDFVDQLRRNEADILIIPRQVFPGVEEFPHRTLYSDRFVAVVDEKNTQIGRTLSLESLSTARYLATTSGRYKSYVEVQMDELGVQRRTEITAGFTVAPLLVAGTEFLTVIHERLGQLLAPRFGLRLLELPVDIPPLTEIMLWTQRSNDDPAHRWLRSQIRSLAADMA